MNRNSIVVDAIRNDARMCVHSKSWEDNAVEQRMKDSDQPGELGKNAVSVGVCRSGLSGLASYAPDRRSGLWRSLEGLSEANESRRDEIFET